MTQRAVADLGRDPAANPRSMALALAGLFFAGGTIGVLTLLLPHPASFDEGPLWSTAALAYACSALIALGAGRLPPWSLQVGVAVGTLLITRAVYHGEVGGGFYSLFYLWVGLYAFFFFGRAWGAVQMAVVGCAYAWVLTQVDQTTPVARWVMTVGTIAIGGVLIDVLAARVRRRAAEADSKAGALAAVASVAHELARRTSPQETGKAICEAAEEVGEAGGAALFEPLSDGSGLVASSATDGKVAGLVIPFLQHPSGVIRAFASGEPLFVTEAKGDPGVSQSLVERFEVESILFQPVLHDANPIGVLVVYWTEPRQRLDPDLEEALALLSVEATLAIERIERLERLEAVARTDELTGLPNRRAWDHQLSREMARARRNRSSLSVAMLDLDHFKQYNDQHGHQAGDRLLKEAAAIWKSLIRESDLLARYGGEEFAIALPDAGVKDARVLLERLREATPEGERSSAGIVSWDGEEGEGSLMARADAALYAAKRGGRDRLFVA